MAKSEQPFTELNRNAVEIALSVAQVSMESAEKLFRLQLEAAKKFVTEQGAVAKEFAEAKDAAAMMALRERVGQQAVNGALEYSRSVQDLAAQAQQQLGKLIQDRYASYQQEATATMEKILKGAPSGSEAMVEAFRSTFAATQAALDNMASAAKQATEVADSNMRAVTEAATGAFRPGAKKK